jgi:hypothetical protein
MAGGEQFGGWSDLLDSIAAGRRMAESLVDVAHSGNDGQAIRIFDDAEYRFGLG